MSIWSAQFHDACALWRFQGINDRGDTSYSPPLKSPPVSFQARIDYTRKEVLDKDGNRVISEASLLTDTLLRPLDKVQCDGQIWTVKSVAPIKNIAGQLDHYEAVL